MRYTLLVILLVILPHALISITTTAASVSDKSNDFATWEFRQCKFYMRVSSDRATASLIVECVVVAAMPENPTSSDEKTNVGAVVGLTILLLFILGVLFIYICRGRRSPSSPRISNIKRVVKLKIPNNVGPAEGNKDEPWDKKKKGVARHKEKKDDLVRRKRAEVEKNENEDNVVRQNTGVKEGIRQKEDVDGKDDVGVGKKVREGKKPQEVVGELKKKSSRLPKIYTYQELTKAGNDFKEDNKIGGGGFGTVYRGTFDDGTMIALKCLKLEGRIDDFRNEIDALGKADHYNLVKLIGYCNKGLMKILVYEYMKNGSLDRWIFNSEIDKFLNWPEMKNIIRGIARGLEYLHENCDKKILHRDLKPANIILDENKNAKLCDFGLAKLINKDQSSTSTACAGTVGYMAPEVKKGKISDKVDVYSFGVVVLEIMFGKRCDKIVNFDEINNVKEFKFDGLIGNLREDLRKNGKEIEMFGKLAMFCLNERPEKRPFMSAVVKAIDGIEARFEARKARGK